MFPQDEEFYLSCENSLVETVMTRLGGQNGMGYSTPEFDESFHNTVANID
jgi:hypothetical protein